MVKLRRCQKNCFVGGPYLTAFGRVVEEGGQGRPGDLDPFQTRQKFCWANLGASVQRQKSHEIPSEEIQCVHVCVKIQGS